jgi:hypothetical protein
MTTHFTDPAFVDRLAGTLLNGPWSKAPMVERAGFAFADDKTLIAKIVPLVRDHFSAGRPKHKILAKFLLKTISKIPHEPDVRERPLDTPTMTACWPVPMLRTTGALAEWTPSWAVFSTHLSRDLQASRSHCRATPGTAGSCQSLEPCSFSLSTVASIRSDGGSDLMNGSRRQSCKELGSKRRHRHSKKKMKSTCKCLNPNIAKRCKVVWKADSRKNFEFSTRCLCEIKCRGSCFPIGHAPTIPSREDAKVDVYNRANDPARREVLVANPTRNDPNVRFAHHG